MKLEAIAAKIGAIKNNFDDINKAFINYYKGVQFMGLFNFLFGKMIDKRITKYQNDLINKQYAEVENMYRTMRGWRHDYHNHIQTMKAYLQMNKIEELEQYLNNLDKDLTTVDTVIKTGNVMVDAILNSKISLAKSKDINVNAKAMEVILRDEHDFVVIYNGNYDSVMHKYGPESTEALAELRTNCHIFSCIAELVKNNWKHHNTLLGFAMDHGCHEIDGNCGSHGLDMLEDINIVHLYKGYPKEEK